MQINLNGKAAVLTGGSTAIGIGVAKVLAASGAKVIVTGREKDTIDKAAASIGSNCVAVVADVTKLSDMQSLYKMVGDKCGRLDVVVANAGIGANAALGHITEDDFEKVIGTNLKGVLFTVQTAWHVLKTGASVILIGSTASVDAPPMMTVYGAAKAGLRAFATTWVKDTKGSCVRINVLSPGGIDTLSLRKALGDDKDEKNVKALKEQSPLGQIGTPGEIGNVVAFLASDAASVIHGAEIFVDGRMKV